MQHRITLVETRLLVEYNRAIEAKKLALGLLTALSKEDPYQFQRMEWPGHDAATGKKYSQHLYTIAGDLRDHTDPLMYSLGGSAAGKVENWGDEAKRTNYANLILAAIETKDPTPNKMYMQWLGRMYAKGGVKFEDLNRVGLLSRYHQYKLKKKLQPEHADINRFKTYADFEAAAQSYPELEDASSDRGKSTEFYEDEDVRVVIPADKDAACYYGRGTKWCTAGRENNMFDAYNSRASLYIFLPKKPRHPREKYQLHAGSSDLQLMDDQDLSVDVPTFMSRFPKAFAYCREHIPTLQPILNTMLGFMDDATLQAHLDRLGGFIGSRLMAQCDAWDGKLKANVDQSSVNTLQRSVEHVRSKIDAYVTSASAADVRQFVAGSDSSDWGAGMLTTFFREHERVMVLYRGAGFQISAIIIQTIDRLLRTMHYRPRSYTRDVVDVSSWQVDWNT